MEIFSKLSNNPNIIYKTTYGWSLVPSLMSKKGYVYVYTDHQMDGDTEIPGVKLGDGKNYVVDLPFLDDIYAKHLNDNTIHITQAEREFWNNKVRCYVNNVEGETFVFTKD